MNATNDDGLFGLARAFNAGSDARLAGLPPTACPPAETHWRNWWHRGWDDVDRKWGTWAKTPVKRLPPVGYGN